MKNINFLLALLFTTLLTGCMREESVISDEEGKETNKGTQMQLSVVMPENEDPNATTRMTLNAGDAETPLNVKLTWKVGDKIYLIFVEGGQVKGKQTVELKSENITNDSKKASFSFTVPEGDGDTFDLYGVHGGGGFLDESSYTLKLPTAEQSTGKSLTELSNSNAVMLKFSQTGISKASATVSASFAHIGSLFRISLKTVSHLLELKTIGKGELYSTSNIPVHQNTGSATYDPVTGGISGTTIKKTLAFINILSDPPIVPGNTLYYTTPFEFWGWFIPEENKNWPWLGLDVTYNNGGNHQATRNFKEARTTPLAVGKAYHFYAYYMIVEGISEATSSTAYLKFTNSAGTVDVNRSFTDLRDNNEYKTVLIGNRLWMKENLKYLPSVNSPFDISIDNPNRVLDDYPKLYYVYGNSTNDVPTAKGSTEYTTYGVLYNQSAAQNACPEGWRLPNYDDWANLYSSLRDDDGVIIGYDNVVGGKLKLPNKDKTNTGATNASDFAARLGGRLNAVLASGTPKGYNAVFDNVSEKGYWWTSTPGFASSLSDDDAKLLILQTVDNQMGFSVRCVRDEGVQY